MSIGNVTAYLESVWAPNKGLNNGRDMQWGGGTLFANQGEIEDTETGQLSSYYFKQMN